MKKIIATLLCLTITTPCFAIDRRHAGPRPIPMIVHSAPHSQMHRPPHRPPVYRYHRVSTGAKVAGAVVGVAGLALLVAAIAD